MAIAGAILIGGCGENMYGTPVEIPLQEYQKNEYKTVMASRGDMSPVVSLKLEQINVTQINYSVDEDELEVESINVGVGDTVKKGQVLVEFKSEEIKKAIETYNDELTKKQMLLDHYTRVSGQTYNDKKREEEFGVILEQLQDDVKLASMFLQQEQERYAKCQIVAQEDGYISYMSNNVLSGLIEAGQTLMTESCGKNRFSDNTRSDFEFKIGDVYSGSDENFTYNMRIVEVIPENDATQTVVFEPVDAVIDPSVKELNMEIKKPMLKDVVYVDQKAVYSKEGKNFVYVVSPEGFLDGVYVDTDEVVDDYAIIRSGLNGTEKVAIK